MKEKFQTLYLFICGRWEISKQDSIFDASSQPLLKDILPSRMFDFKVGDTVCLITSPQDIMTVCSVFGQRLVECSWVGKEGKTYKHSFRPESLQLVDPDKLQDSEERHEGILKIDFSEDEDEDTFNF